MNVNSAECLNLDNTLTLQELFSIVLIRPPGRVIQKTFAKAQEKFLLAPGTACSASVHTSSRICSGQE